MSISIDKLLEEPRNIYEVTSAVIRRAAQVGEIRRAFSSDEHGSVSEDGVKVVSQAISEIIDRQVYFRVGAR